MSTPEKRINSREALLEAAKHLFIEKGFDAVSTRDLADAAGVNLGAIQYHFGSKANLFLETVHHLMEGSGCTQTSTQLSGPIASPQDAGARLVSFIREFITYLVQPADPKPCRLMIREVFTQTAQNKEMFEALIASVVKDFIKPIDDRLLEVMRILSPKSSHDELGLLIQSVVGQCSYYLTHGPFVERLRNRSLLDPDFMSEVVIHIARFSLRGMGHSEAFISDAIELATAQEPQLNPEATPVNTGRY